MRRSAGLPSEAAALLEGAIRAGPVAARIRLPGGGSDGCFSIRDDEKEEGEGGGPILCLFPPSRLVQRAMDALVETALGASGDHDQEGENQNERGEGREESDPWPRVHALNALRVLLDDGATSQACLPWLPRALDAALA